MSEAENQSSAEPFTQPLTPLPSSQLKEEGEQEAREAEAVVERVTAEPVLLQTELIEEPPAPVAVKKAAPKRWMFWKRRDRRDEQLQVLRQGTSEMVGLMRSIRDHLESEHRDRQELSESLSPLPVAVESLQSMSESQVHTGRMLGELKNSMERSAEKDGYLLKSLNRIGETMTSVDKTFSEMDRTLGDFDKSNQRSLQTMEQLGERVEESDRFMNETFVRLRDAEKEFTDYVARASRRGTFAMVSVCTMLMCSIVAVGFMFKENRELLSAARADGPLIVRVPSEGGRLENVAALREIEGDEGGVGALEGEGSDPGTRQEDGFRMHTNPERFLSANELPPRE